MDRAIRISFGLTIALIVFVADTAYGWPRLLSRRANSAKVYRLFVNLHRRSAEYGRDTAIGKLALPYYVATAGETRLGRARRHIAMRTFKEFYYAQQGWASEERYPMDCYAYYTWATGSCTVGARNGFAILDRLFGGRRPFQQGGHPPGADLRASIEWTGYLADGGRFNRAG